jgi:adenosylhomocysteine nucleosidase
MGPASMQAISNPAIWQEATGLVSIGTAGALKPELTPGDLLIPERIHHIDGQKFSVDADWRQSVVQSLQGRLNSNGGDLVCTPSVVREPRQKALLHERTGAVGVDMESGGFALAASNRGIPFLAIRVVLDKTSDTIPRSATSGLTANGDVRLTPLIAALLSQPAEIPQMLLMAIRFRTAARTLRVVGRTASAELLNTTRNRLL